MTGMTDDRDLGRDLDQDLDRDLDRDLILELDWARDLFDRARGAGEPAWTADSPALARAGDRRRRLRTVGVAGGLASVVALTTAVAVGLGAGTADLGSQPGPGGAWGNRPLSDVFQYASYRGSVDTSGQAYIPAPAASDLAAVIARVDPSLTHFVGEKEHRPHIVAADDPNTAKNNYALAMSSVWVDDSPRQAGIVTFGFASSSGWAQTIGVTTDLDTSSLEGACAVAVGPVSTVPANTVPPRDSSALPVHWSPCSMVRLNDGSTVASSSARVGEGTAVVALRQFADGELISVFAQDYGSSTTWQPTGPDPATVVHPTPWTEQSLAAALADPAVRSGWNKLPPPNADGRLLQPADLGADWVFDTGRADENVAMRLPFVNGCASVVSVPLAGSATAAAYWGPLPDGTSGTVAEVEYPLVGGTGAKAMTTARAAAQGGCKDGPVDYSKDTVIPLPAGIGDDAFAAAIPALGDVRITVRIGDTLLRTDISNANHIRDASWTTKKPLDLTSPGDQQWLAGIARSMVARYTGTAPRH